MVTDIAAYIGTSNWSGDYFIDTAGKLLQCCFYENKITQIKVVIKFYVCRFYKLLKILNKSSFFYYFFSIKIYFNANVQIQVSVLYLKALDVKIGII